MDFISSLPTELFEEIFQYICLEDLSRCSQVSVRWWDVANNNILWHKHCLKLKIADEEFLDVSKSLKKNPFDKFKEQVFDPQTTRLAPPCRWRSHLARYKFLDRNWRNGCSSKKSETIEINECINGIMINKLAKELTAYSIHDMTKEMRIETPHVLSVTYDFYAKDNLLFYAQKTDVVCEKMNNFSFTKNFIISMPTTLMKQCQSREPTPGVTLKVSNDFFVVQYLQNGCSLFFHDLSGGFLRRVNCHSFIGEQCPRFTCLQVYNEKVFIAYSIDESHSVMIYNFIKDKVDGTLWSAAESAMLTVSRNYLAALSIEGNRLHVWSTISNMLVFHVFKMNPHLLLDNKVIYGQHRRITVRSLGSPHSKITINLSANVAEMAATRGDILVVRTETLTITFYDISNGSKLHTLTQRNVFKMFVSNTYIVTHGKKPGDLKCLTCVFGFW